MENSVFETLDCKGAKPVATRTQKRYIKPGPVNGYIYKDAKPTGDYDLDRIRTFVKTEINGEPNNDPEQVWYNVDYGTNQKQGKFYALRCHLGQKKQKIIKKSYNVDELVTYFFGPICEDDFNGYSQYPETWAHRSMIWNQFYNRKVWLMHINGGDTQYKTDAEARMEATKKRAEERKAAGERSVFEDLELVDNLGASTNSRDTAKERIQPYARRLLSAIIQQMSSGCLYADPYANGAGPVLNSIDDKYLAEDVKHEILDISGIESELETMIDKAAQALGKKMPVYEAGQRSEFTAPGDPGYDVHYSANKKLVHNYVRELVKDMCDMGEMSDEQKKEELDRVYCTRLY